MIRKEFHPSACWAIRNLNGIAVSIANGSGGATTLTTAGTISSMLVLGMSPVAGQNTVDGAVGRRPGARPTRRVV
ncbi:hypothetical protein [Pseudomonas sp. UBA3153]|uniref:hypothetical protein n=1 Tax=Pseudomonas sp. UBA3153 TaxID=1947313 RepID=UPI0025797BAF|nr:hypothetical protein [Pseudomonas sp. UBA3153]